MNIQCIRETIAWLLTFPKAGSTELLILIVMEKMQQIPGHDLEAFALEICDEYHGQGHINVGELCPDGNGPNGLMTFSECSAR